MKITERGRRMLDRIRQAMLDERTSRRNPVLINWRVHRKDSAKWVTGHLEFCPDRDEVISIPIGLNEGADASPGTYPTIDDVISAGQREYDAAWRAIFDSTPSYPKFRNGTP